MTINEIIEELTKAAAKFGGETELIFGKDMVDGAGYTMGIQEYEYVAGCEIVGAEVYLVDADVKVKRFAAHEDDKIDVVAVKWW